MKRSIISLAFLLFWLTLSNGQARMVHGRLTAFNTYPVLNMEVKSKKAGNSVLTDSSGWFSIECMKKDVVLIRSKVFESLTIRVNEDTDSIVRNLIFIDNRDNRQVATGFGYMSQENLAFAMNHLTRQNNDFCNYNNVFELIEGKFPGVVVESRGSGGAIYIRGSSSSGARSSALTVVDGVIGGIGWISPCDVQSIDIIKDGMSAMYGSEGGNGVVIIETIHGKAQSQ